MSLALQVKLLGELSITYGDRPIAGFNTARSQALLAYLVLHRHSPQSRQRLAFHLWPDSTEPQAKSNLRKELSYLRRDLPQADQCLLIEPRTLQWLPTAPVTLDVMEFENAVKVAETAAPDAKQSLLKHVIALYSGDLLQSCDDDWIVPERERFQQMYISALERLIDRLQEQQDYRSALTYAQQLLRADAFNEATYCTLMRLYNLTGDRANALQVYHRCMTTLRDELGVDPGIATRKLYEQLLHEEELGESRSWAVGRDKRDKSSPSTPSSPPTLLPHIDWGDAIDVSTFYGRDAELTTLQEWVTRCRLILLLGMGGIGKTALAVKLAQKLIQPSTVNPQNFEFIIWRSLRNAPPLSALLTDWVSVLSHQQDTQADLSRLLYYLRSHRCLLILDNVETIFQEGDRAGHYRLGYEAYGELLQRIGETPHQSCLILTSREKPVEVVVLEDGECVRSLQLSGAPEAAQAWIEARNLFGSTEQKQKLADCYSNNPLAVKIVTSSIQDLFDGDIEQFFQQDIILFNGLRRLLEQQFERLSYLEQTVMYWLAINREWIAIAELADDIVPTVSRANLLEALESLVWRSLIEHRSGQYTQQPVVMEYFTSRLIEQVVTELVTQKLNVCDRYALLKTTVKDYIREGQTRFILEPVANQLRTVFSRSTELEQQLQKVCNQLKTKPSSVYGAGNLINLLCCLKIPLTRYDFSMLTIVHAYLQGMVLQQVNFRGATFIKSVFTQTFGVVFSTALSPDGELLAAGDDNGQVQLWRVSDGQPLLSIQAHESWIKSIAWSPDGQVLASSSADQKIQLWNRSGQCLQTLQGHIGWIRSISWRADGQAIVSASADQTVKVWDTTTGVCLKTLVSFRGR
jgi:DNA-binding SARP family transcriptional activator